MDFTLNTYTNLLTSLQHAGYTFQTFEEFIRTPKEKAVVLRHDVDKLPQNSLRFARIQHEMGIRGTYYFRIVTQSWDEEIIRKIAEMGHEIGYHYETMDTANGDINKAYKEFTANLKKLRSLIPVSTIAMHGSPLSKYDNKDLWKEYDYKSLGLIAEPYFDIDFHKVFYITDTGRKWNNAAASVRDKVDSGFDISIKSTRDFAVMAREDKLPAQIMINTHPQRWFPPGPGWLKELVLQNIKNQVKKLLVLWR